MNHTSSPAMPSGVQQTLGLFDRSAGCSTRLVRGLPHPILRQRGPLIVIAWIIEGAVRVAVERNFAAVLDEVPHAHG